MASSEVTSCTSDTSDQCRSGGKTFPLHSEDRIVNDLSSALRKVDLSKSEQQRQACKPGRATHSNSASRKGATNFYRQGQKKEYASNFSHGWTANQDQAFKFDPLKTTEKSPVKPEFSKRNTENFTPSHEPPQMRILAAFPGLLRYNRPYMSRDVLIVHGLFCDVQDLSMYETLLKEIEVSGIDKHDLWQLWHGDSHVIADDKLRWKDHCPTFRFVLDRVSRYFDLDVKATRLNWYRDSSEWKPFHHDAAAIKPDKAREQNFTVAVSFGAERDVAFEHAKTRTVISMPQPNGTAYSFGKDVNILWRHGVLQVPPESYHSQGRISIIAWGWIPGMTDA